MEGKKGLIFFDFDGVIADSFAVALAVNLKLYPGSTEEEYRTAFNGNILEWVKKWEHTFRKGFSFADEYEKESHRIQFFAVEKVIPALAEKYLLTIVSSTGSWHIEAFLKREKLRECFADIMGADVHESKHRKIQDLLAKYEVAPEKSVMITDTLGDIREARMAGVDSIGVSWGFQDIETLKRGEPVAIANEPEDLLEIIDAHFNNPNTLLKS